MRRATTDLTTALNGGYIGETHITPRKIVNAVRLAVRHKPVKNVIVYYYGDHDIELDKLFGYTTKGE